MEKDAARHLFLFYTTVITRRASFFYVVTVFRTCLSVFFNKFES